MTHKTVHKKVVHQTVDQAIGQTLPYWRTFTPEQKMLGLFLVAAVLVIGLMHFEYWFPIVRWFWGLLKLPSWKKGIRVGSVHIPDDARLRHTHIVGATGTGKTVLLEQLLFADLKRGGGAIVIDPKGDRSFYESLKSYCASIGRENDLLLLSAEDPDESCAWNPCSLGDPSDLQTKFYNSSVFEEPHYAKACEWGLTVAFKKLAGRQIGLKDLVDQLGELAKGERKDIFQGLFLDLGCLTDSKWGALLSPGAGSTKPVLSLVDVIKGNKILFVSLPTERQRVISSRIGRLLLQEIILVSGMRQGDHRLKSGKPFSVYVDEFDAFATESFSSFLNKARSSDFMIHIAHQTLSDLNEISDEFTGKVMGNTNVRFIFRQDSPDDAETWSRYLGTRKVVKKTYKTENGSKTGEMSNREAHEFIVAPDRIKTLPIGRCVFSMKTENVCRVVKVPLKKRKLPKLQPASGVVLAASTCATYEQVPQALPPEPTSPKRWTRLEGSLSFSPEPSRPQQGGDAHGLE